MAEARAAGFELEDYETDIVEIWPEHVPAYRLLLQVGTRWVVGMSSVVGIRYEAIYPLMDRMNLTPDEWDSLLSDLEVMEHEALKVINQK